MLVFMGNGGQETQIPEIWETDEEKRLSVGQLKYECLQAAKQDFQGKIFINKKAVFGQHGPPDESGRPASLIRLSGNTL
jgi:hypothetical protein